MVQSRHILILILSMAAVACSKATPTFDLADEDSIPMPKFSGSTTKNITATSSGLTFQISGQCDPKIRALVALPVGVVTGFSTVGDYTVSSPTVNCSSAGTFSFELKSLSSLGFSGFTEGKVFEIQLKASTSAGYSKASKIMITYSLGGNKSIWLAAGGVHGGAIRATDSVVKADLTVNFTNSSNGSGPYPTDGTTTARFGAAAR